jgi:hypothetical protein
MTMRSMTEESVYIFLFSFTIGLLLQGLLVSGHDDDDDESGVFFNLYYCFILLIDGWQPTGFYVMGHDNDDVTTMTDDDGE